MTRFLYVLASIVSVAIMPLFVGDHAHAADNQELANAARQCEQGNASRCMDLAAYYQRDTYSASNALKALRIYKKACRLGAPEGCFEAGNMHFHGIGIAANFERAAAWYSKGCTFEHSPSCNRVSRAERELKTAMKVRELELKCDARQASSCHALGHIIYKRSFKYGYENALELYLRGCELGYIPSCKQAAAMFQAGRSVEQDMAKANSLLKTACILGDSTSCTKVYEPGPSGQFARLEANCQAKSAAACIDAAKMLENRQLDTEKPVKIAELYNTACNLGNLSACLRLVDVHQQGLGVRRSIFSATKALARACRLGSTISCVKAGEAYLAGTGMKRNLRRAAEFLHHGCDANIERACSQLVSIYQDPSIEFLDKDKASKLLENACNAGKKSACQRLAVAMRDDRTIRRATFMRDFELTKKHLKDFHPNLYAHSTPKQLNRVWKKIEADIPEMLNRADAVTYLQMLMASACDEHTTVRWKKDMENTAFKSALPFELFVRDGKLYFDGSPGFRSDWPITKIGNKSDEQIIDFLARIQTADGCSKGRMQFTRLLSNGVPANPMLANFIASGSRSFKVEQRSEADGRTHRRTYSFSNFSIYMINARYWGFKTSNRTAAANAGFKPDGYSPTNAPFAVFYNADSSLAYVYVDRFREDVRFREVLDEKMRELVKRNPAKVIIDLSKNPGGHLDTAQRFASYFLRTGSRLGSTVRSTVKRTNKTKGLEWDRWEVQNGVKETKTFLREWGRKRGNIRQIAFRKKSFGNRSTNAKLSVIISPATHSAATFVSTTLKRLNNAKIYGYIGDLSMEKSCIAPQAHFLLPNTNLRIEVPFVCFSRNPKAKTSGNIADAAFPSLEGVRSLTGLITNSLQLALDDAIRKVAAN